MKMNIISVSLLYAAYLTLCLEQPKEQVRELLVKDLEKVENNQ